MNTRTTATLEPRKLRLAERISWSHHRGGWKDVLRVVEESFCDSSAPTLFVGAIEDHLLNHGRIEQPWIGVAHQVPRQTLAFPDLERLISMPEWVQSLPSCRGIYTLSRYAKDYLVSRGVPVPVCMLHYPVDQRVPQFSWARAGTKRPRRLRSEEHTSEL